MGLKAVRVSWEISTGDTADSDSKSCKSVEEAVSGAAPPEAYLRQHPYIRVIESRESLIVSRAKLEDISRNAMTQSLNSARIHRSQIGQTRKDKHQNGKAEKEYKVSQGLSLARYLNDIANQSSCVAIARVAS